MDEDEPMVDEIEAETHNHILPFPIPWTLEFGSALDEETGTVHGLFDIYTYQGMTRLFYPPDWGIEMSNSWHSAAVMAKARQGKGGLVVAQTDLAGLGLTGPNRAERRRRS